MASVLLWVATAMIVVFAWAATVAGCDPIRFYSESLEHAHANGRCLTTEPRVLNHRGVNYVADVCTEGKR